MQSKIKDLQAEQMIQRIKSTFTERLREHLLLHPVYAPLYVPANTGINDNLNGVEQPVRFSSGGQVLEVVHSLAKWKRMRLRDLEIPLHEGILTNMIALRPDEVCSDIHAVAVDQWDWEMRIAPEDRTLSFLQRTVRNIYEQIRLTEQELALLHMVDPVLPSSITFIHSEALQARFPDKTPGEREDLITAEHGAVFLIGIGGKLADGKPHDLRAPDYDDWTTPTGAGNCGLNGDILLWHPVLKRSFEVSSMGIRVDAAALEKQLELTGTGARREHPFHKALLEGHLPLSIGGGIGQSRLCMFLLRSRHISEVQCYDYQV